jgi:hypothetical protein
MSRQQEEFNSRANETLNKAALETGPYRDVLLGVAEAYKVLAFHQGVLDEWPRLYPGPSSPRNQPASGEARDRNRS